MRRRSLSGLVGPLVLIASCASPAATPDLSSTGPSADSSAAVASAAPVAIPDGQLTPGATYLLPTTPVLAIAPPEAWGASHTTDGVQLIKQRTTVRIASGYDSVYLNEATVEPIGSDAAAIAEQIARHYQFEVSEPATTEIAGLPAVYIDADVIYERNIEGGANLFRTDQTPFFIPDNTLASVFIIDTSSGPIFVIVSGPRTSGRDAMLDQSASLLDSITLSD